MCDLLPIGVISCQSGGDQARRCMVLQTGQAAHLRGLPHDGLATDGPPCSPRGSSPRQAPWARLSGQGHIFVTSCHKPTIPSPVATCRVGCLRRGMLPTPIGRRAAPHACDRLSRFPPSGHPPSGPGPRREDALFSPPPARLKWVLFSFLWAEPEFFFGLAASGSPFFH